MLDPRMREGWLVEGAVDGDAAPAREAPAAGSPARAGLLATGGVATPGACRVYYADISFCTMPRGRADDVRAWCEVRAAICHENDPLALLPGENVLFAPATDEGARTLAEALRDLDDLGAWARAQDAAEAADPGERAGEAGDARARPRA